MFARGGGEAHLRQRAQVFDTHGHTACERDRRVAMQAVLAALERALQQFANLAAWQINNSFLLLVRLVSFL